MTQKDTRLRCPFCGTRSWGSDYKMFMTDHDRPDGRHCRKAAQQQKVLEKKAEVLR